MISKLVAGLALQALNSTAPQWTVFALVTGGLVVGIIVLTRRTAKQLSSQQVLTEQPVSTRLLVGNIALTHGGLLIVILGAAVVTGVPTAVFGSVAIDVETFAIGLVVGVFGYLLAEGLVAGLALGGLQTNRELTRLLAPETRTEALLLGAIALPLIAAAEELLYRGAVLGALAAGTTVPEWALLIASSIAFGLSHTLQGHGGVIVATVLGGLLGGVFLLTDSLTVVVVAHYVINALEIGAVSIRERRVNRSERFV